MRTHLLNTHVIEQNDTKDASDRVVTSSRRSFLSTLLKAALASSVGPSLFVPKLIELPRWKRNKGWCVMENRHVINPEWVKAEYEVMFVDMPMMVDERILEECRISKQPWADIRRLTALPLL